MLRGDPGTVGGLLRRVPRSPRRTAASPALRARVAVQRRRASPGAGRRLRCGIGVRLGPRPGAVPCSGQPPGGPAIDSSDCGCQPGPGHMRRRHSEPAPSCRGLAVGGGPTRRRADSDMAARPTERPILWLAPPGPDNCLWRADSRRRPEATLARRGGGGQTRSDSERRAAGREARARRGQGRSRRHALVH